jgi:hypothetical protein
MGAEFTPGHHRPGGIDAQHQLSAVVKGQVAGIAHGRFIALTSSAFTGRLAGHARPLSA